MLTPEDLARFRDIPLDDVDDAFEQAAVITQRLAAVLFNGERNIDVNYYTAAALAIRQVAAAMISSGYPRSMYAKVVSCWAENIMSLLELTADDDVTDAVIE
jgi:hypothetical protein